MFLWTLGFVNVFKLEFSYFSRYIPSSGIAGSYGSSLFSFLRTLHPVFCSGCTSLHSHQQCRRVPFSSHPHQYSLFADFLKIVPLTGVRWSLVILMCISLILSNTERLSMCLSVCLWDRTFGAGVEINREILECIWWGWEHRPERVYLGRGRNARSPQLSLGELQHILVVVGVSTEEAENEQSES